MFSVNCAEKQRSLPIQSLFCSNSKQLLSAVANAPLTQSYFGILESNFHNITYLYFIFEWGKHCCSFSNCPRTKQSASSRICRTGKKKFLFPARKILTPSNTPFFAPLLTNVPPTSFGRAEEVQTAIITPDYFCLSVWLLLTLLPMFHNAHTHKAGWHCHMTPPPPEQWGLDPADLCLSWCGIHLH